jgi:hypothetical protein
VRILPRQQLEQQFVQVVAREHRRSRQQRRAAGPFGRAQRAHLGLFVGRHLAQQCASTGWKGSSTDRSCEVGRLAPLAATTTRPCSRVNSSTIRLVSLQSYWCST